MPDQPFLADQAQREQQQLALKNRRRLDAILIKAEGVEPRTSQVDDVQAFDLIAKPITPYKIRRFVVLDKTAVLITPGTCPHLFAADHCKGGRLTTEITAKGTLECVGPFTAPEHLRIELPPGSDRVRLDFGKPLIVRSEAPSFAMFSPDGKATGKAERRINDYEDAIPEEVIATLTLETEQPAAVLWKNVPASLRTDEIEAKVAKARIDAVRGKAVGADGPDTALHLARTHLMNGTLPGDEAVAAIVREKLILGARQVDESTPEKFRLGISLVKVLKVYRGTDADITATGLEERYGPRFADGTLNDPKDRDGFLTTFPSSKYGEKVRQLIAAEIQKNNTDQHVREAEAAIGGDFAGIAELADKIVTTRWQANMVIRNIGMMRNQRRSLAGAEAFKAEADRMQREEFCPARREFAKKWGAKQLQTRAKEKCDSEPPMTRGEFGRDVKLDKECRAIFASGC